MNNKIIKSDQYFDYYEGDEKIVKSIKRFLTKTFGEMKWDFIKKKRAWGYVTYRFCEFSKKTPSKITFRRGYSAIIASTFNLELYNNDIIPPLEKWIEVFKNHPKGEVYANIQLSAYYSLLETPINLISLPTGLGKTELILAVLESYLHNYNNNVVIITYSKKVLEELQLRADKYNVKSDRLKFICPTGYCRTNEYKSGKDKEWFNNVELVIADEAHHFSNSSGGTWFDFVSLCNPNFLYGFSATSEISDGNTVNYEFLTNNNVTYQVMSLVSHTGLISVHHELLLPVDLIVAECNVTNKSEYCTLNKNISEKSKLPSLFYNSTKGMDIIVDIVKERLPNGITFIPELISLETGDILCEYLNSKGIRTVFFNGSFVNTPIGKVENFGLLDLKKSAENKDFDVLISNVVGIEGIDLKNLTSVISLTGSSFKSLIQPLGRSARGDELTCVLIKDKYNTVLNNQTENKLCYINKRLNVKSHRSLMYDK